jgi:hypothetical protein
VATCSRVSKRWLWPPVSQTLEATIVRWDGDGGGGGGGGVDIRGFFFSSLVLNFGRRKRGRGLGRGTARGRTRKLSEPFVDGQTLKPMGEGGRIQKERRTATHIHVFVFIIEFLGQKFTAGPRDVICSKRKGLTTLRQREENETTPKTEKGGQREEAGGMVVATLMVQRRGPLQWWRLLSP